MFKFLPDHPHVHRDPEDIDRLTGTVLGNDLEWDQYNRPTILGLSDGQYTVSVPFQDGIDRFRELLTRTDITWVGHNIVAADLLVLEQMGLRLPLEQCEDTLLYMWLINPNLAKSSGKAALQEDEGERRGRGFFNLSTLLSVYTDLPHYKDCRGEDCCGACPKHQPFEYNGLDSLGPVLALPKLRQQARLRGVAQLYPFHRQLAYDLATIQDAGVRINVPFVYSRDRHSLGSEDGSSLDERFRKAKDEIESTLPFNPRSPKSIKDFFYDRYNIRLEDAQEETISSLVEEMEFSAPRELKSLLSFKELGNGCDRWFLPQYRNKDGWTEGYMDLAGYIHPRTILLTSSTRLAQSKPNMQNVSARRTLPDGTSIKKVVRKAIIAPLGHYVVRADLSNGEGRAMLYQAGYTNVPKDMHTWMISQIGLIEDEPFSRALGSARDASKSVIHASNYGEGLQLKTLGELRTPRMRKEIDEGSRVVFWDWTFKGRIITFTGVNLAIRAFGSKTIENRRRALDVMTRYIDKTFPEIRTLQRKITKQVEREGCIRPPLGYVLPSYDPRGEDQIKTAFSVYGQQPVAQLNKLAIVDISRKHREGRPMRVAIPVHDEIVAYVRDDVDPKEAMAWLKQSMEQVMPEMPGLVIPADPSYGPNWAEQSKGELC
jgi:DNA polymerase I-like protein with 3'-5' exonuclease and polymerase domains